MPRCSQQSISIARLDDDASGCLVLRPRLPSPVCLNHPQKEDDTDCGESGEDFRQLPAELHHYLLLALSQPRSSRCLSRYLKADTVPRRRRATGQRTGGPCPLPSIEAIQGMVFVLCGNARRDHFVQMLPADVSLLPGDNSVSAGCWSRLCHHVGAGA